MRIPGVFLMTALTLAGFCILPPAATAQGAEALTGWWSRLISGSQGRMREVLELRADGSYINGICLTGQSGWCEGKAQPQIQGSYSLSGSSLVLENGLINQHVLDNFAKPDRPRVELKSKRGRQAYKLQVDVIPDVPPTGRPPSKSVFNKVQFWPGGESSDGSSPLV
jgi:hypothetical protein